MALLTALLLLIATILSARLAWLRARSGHMTCLFYGFDFLFFGISGLFRLITGLEYSYPPGFASHLTDMTLISRFSEFVQFKSAVVHALVIASFALGERLALRRSPTLPQLTTTSAAVGSRTMMWITLVLAVCGFRLLLWSKGIPLRLDYMVSTEARTDNRIAIHWVGAVVGGQLFALIMVATYLILNRRQYLLLIVPAVVCYLMTASTGTRAFGMYFIGPVLGWYLRDIRIRRHTFRPQHLIGALTLLVAAPAFSELLRIWRWGEERTVSTLVRLAIDPRTYDMVFSYPLSEFNIYTYFLDWTTMQFPQAHEWTYGGTYISILLFWLPSTHAGGWKQDAIHVFADAVCGTVTSYEDKFSMHPTFFGDCYMNLGWFCWIAAYVWGWILGRAQTRSNRGGAGDILLGSLGAYFLLYLFRGSIYTGCFTCFIGYFYCLVWRPSVHVEYADTRDSNASAHNLHAEPPVLRA